jgi:hypothetical protein
VAAAPAEPVAPAVVAAPAPPAPAAALASPEAGAGEAPIPIGWAAESSEGSASEGPSQEDLYALSAGEPVAAAPPTIAPVAMVAATGARVGGAVPILGYVPQAKREEEDSGLEGYAFRDLYLPIIIVVAGILISVVQMRYAERVPVVLALLAVGLVLLVNLVFMVIGCLAAIKMIDVAFGPPLQAFLKMSAILIGPGAAGTLIEYLLGGGWGGWFAGYGTSLGLYYALFMVFFDLDLGEVLLLTGILFIIRMFVSIALAGILVSMVMSGKGGAGVATTVAMTSALSGPRVQPVKDPRVPLASARVMRDAEVFSKASAPDARQWLAESPERVIQSYERPGSVKLVEDLYAMGAAQVQAAEASGRFDGVQEAQVVVMLLPSDKAARKRLFDWHEKYASEREMLGYLPDKGQAYMVLYMREASKKAKDEYTKLDWNPAMMRDTTAQRKLQDPNYTANAVWWLKGRDDHWRKLSGISFEESVKIVREVQALKAEEIMAVDKGGEEFAGNSWNAYRGLVIKLPVKGRDRAKLIKWHNDYALMHPGNVVVEDAGQRYLLVIPGPAEANPAATQPVSEPEEPEEAPVGAESDEE